MAASGVEEHFAKKLANNEKRIRDRAVNKLRAWIRSRPNEGPGFDELDMLKIWKGLFYCMWMSDKPLIQEELALNISQLVLSFRNEQSAVLFIKTFFKTMQREWHGIDRLRLDKFYLLIRFFVKETFNFLKKNSWEDRLVTEVKCLFQEEPLNPTSQAVCTLVVFFFRVGTFSKKVWCLKPNSFRWLVKKEYSMILIAKKQWWLKPNTFQ